MEQSRVPAGLHRFEPEATTAAQQLIRTLVDAGVETFFGIPGGPISPVFDAILRTDGARLIESRHEACAAFAAADYFRASGRVAAVVVTAGPGATNAVTGVASAHFEGVPMLVICGDVSWAPTGARLLQDSGPEGIAAEQLFRNVARATIRVARAESMASQGLAALNAATNPARPGPALLVVPMQFGRAVVQRHRLTRARAIFEAAASNDDVLRATKWLGAAARPLLVLGAACRAHATEIRLLVDALEVPFVTTPRAKGVVSETHPLSLRNGGLAASEWARRYTELGVDCALVLGSDLDDCSVGPTRYVAKDGKLIHVDLDATVFHRSLPASLGIVADLRSFARKLRELWTPTAKRNGWRATMRHIREQPPFAVANFASDASLRVAPHRAIADLQAAAGSTATFITDIGEHMLFALHYLTAERPDAFTIHLAHGSMGSGIGGAIGLALAAPDRPVVCICGDGGMQMAGMEALVALEHRLPIIYAVFNDARYNMVFHGFRQVYGRQAEWDTGWIDFAAWARSMNLVGVRIERPGELQEGLLVELREAGVPVVLDIRIDRDVRLQGGGRNEALQQMSALPSSAEFM